MTRDRTREDLTHSEAEHLLPWLVNDELDDDERRRVEAHCGDCEDCRDQLAALTELRRSIQATAELDPDPSQGLRARTLARIDADRATKRGRLNPLAWLQFTPWPVRVVLATQLVLLLGLLAVLFFRTPSGPVATAGDDSIVTDDQGPRIQVGFVPTAVEPAIREALQAIGGEVVSGPDAIGLYTIELGDEAEGVDVALRELRRRVEVVDFAEPLGRRSAP